MGKKGKQPWNREKLPIGTIRVRKHSKRVSVRMIKVADDGPKGRRWMTVARYWWLQNRGPIPAGMRVVHKDGNPLNDNPTNYLLATAGDVAYLAREWDSSLDARNAEACGKATARCNRERARVNQALTYLPTRWYAVDMQAQIVINRPYRSRLQLWREHVDQTAQAKNGAGLLGRWLGWPEVTAAEACVLAVLHASEDSLTVPDIVGRVCDLRYLYGLPQIKSHLTINSTLHLLRKRGWILTHRRSGESRRRYRLTGEAIAAKLEPVAILAVRGAEIEERFPDFKKVWPEQLVGAASRAAPTTTPATDPARLAGSTEGATTCKP